MSKDKFNIDEFVIDDVFDLMSANEDKISKKEKKKHKNKKYVSDQSSNDREVISINV